MDHPQIEGEIGATLAGDEPVTREPIQVEVAPPAPRLPRAARLAWRATLPASLAILVALLAVLVLPPLHNRLGLFVVATPTVTPAPIPTDSYQYPATPVDAQVWATLESRPLLFPTLAPGAACPTVAGRQPNNEVGIAQGHTPAFVVGLGADDVLPYVPPQSWGYQPTDWGGNKVVWTTGPNYVGPLLVRGAQIDGSHQVRFNGGLDQQAYPGDLASAPPIPALRLYPNDPNTMWINEVVNIRVRASGCYALQIDGLNFTELIVFAARPGQ
ncbi:MAG TPA: hypothetical protein VJN88_00280 [Ktedonobacterales bacterium]|nr:hypothetical protein [Ktedonobacterales bacterium]